MFFQTKAPSKDDIAEWFKGKQFTTDWTSQYLASWKKAFAHLPSNDEIQVLEIGTWEGRSTIAILNLLPRSHVTAVDGWWHAEGQERMKRFDANVSEFSGRVEKCQRDSVSAMMVMISAGKKYDLIYIDGDHRRNSVIADTLYAWLLLKENGILMWDDYQWEPNYADELRPFSAINWILEKFTGRYTILHKDYQVIIKKIVPY